LTLPHFSALFDNHPVKSIAAEGNYVAALIDYQLDSSHPGTPPFLFVVKDNFSSPFSINENVKQIGLTKLRTGMDVIIALTDDNFYLITSGSLIKKISLSSVISSFAITDLKNDGENYIVYNSGNQIHALNLSGAEAVNFPYTDPDNKKFTGSPLCADFEGDNKSEVISFTQDGRIIALDGGTGRLVTGFPISSGLFIETAELFDYNFRMSLAVIDSGNHFYGWAIGSTPGNSYWTEENGNNLNNSFVNSASQSNYVNEFFPKSKVYNYPNPVYNGVTAIRYYVSENSKINIKIFDLAGDFVAELNDNAQGGFDSETLWKVNNIQSGIYLARIEAVGASGKSESNIIKIAIVK
jgi:hypothetical protein